MQTLSVIKKFITGNRDVAIETKSSEAYDLWSDTYDNQHGNLMLDLDEIIFSQLFNAVDVKNKIVADVGCGTGRHWPKIYSKKPAQLTGFDSSAGMLEMLKQKFSRSEIIHICDDDFKNVPNAFYDCIISTLTIAHIKNIKVAIDAWCRILKKDAEIIITDFHPAVLASGGRRSFMHEKKHLYVTNYVHHVSEVKKIFSQNGFYVHAECEKIIDDTVKNYYVQQNGLHVFEKYKTYPVIYGLHLKRGNGIK